MQANIVYNPSTDLFDIICDSETVESYETHQDAEDEFNYVCKIYKQNQEITELRAIERQIWASQRYLREGGLERQEYLDERAYLAGKVRRFNQLAESLQISLRY
jgi:hypothetical protein